MNAKKFISVMGFSFVAVSFMVAGFVYLLDPYGLYSHNALDLKKTVQSNKMRLVKVLKVGQLKPKSITLGTSRAEYGYDPSHAYFTQPAYNFAVSGGSMYENRLNFEWALEQGRLEKVLLVADWRMFTNKTQKKLPDFESYFESTVWAKYKYMFSFDAFLDSVEMIRTQNKPYAKYLPTGQRGHTYNWQRIKERGGHLAAFQDHADYYEDYNTNYTYGNTGNSAMKDFKQILKLAYKNGITVDIIFGPGHACQWEAFDLALDYDLWLNWKKDVVDEVTAIAERYNKKPFRVVDFSLYNRYTMEKVPHDPTQQMQWHWESSHYRHALGQKVLDFLHSGKTDGIGVILDAATIKSHLAALKQQRKNLQLSSRYQKRIIDYR